MEDVAVTYTRNWIIQVVIGCNFCPFAAKEIRLDSIRYTVSKLKIAQECMDLLTEECRVLDTDHSIATTLLVFPLSFTDFHEFLDLVDQAEQFITQQGYEGIYQVASFHPEYLFAGSSESDAANYTNRSPYPMLHLLREDQVEKAIEKYPNAEDIPEKNMRFAEEKGLDFMKRLKAHSMQVS